MAAGSYTVTATAQNDRGVSVTSAPIIVKISKALKAVRGGKRNADSLSSSFSVSETTGPLDSTELTQLEALTVEMDQIYADFADERTLFPKNQSIEKYLLAASYLARSSAALSAESTLSSGVKDRLKKVSAYLSVTDDLMVKEQISSSTLAEASRANARIDLSSVQPTTDPISPSADMGFSVLPNGVAKISSSSANPFSTKIATSNSGGSCELEDVMVHI